MGMNRHRMTEQITHKGYTIKQICSLMNQKGVKVRYVQLYKALQDRPNKTSRETFLTDTALDLLKSLPDLGDGSDELTLKIKAEGFTVCDVWRYYMRTRDKSYSYPAFRNSCKNPDMPYQQRLRVEAVKCLEEMTTLKAEGAL